MKYRILITTIELGNDYRFRLKIIIVGTAKKFKIINEVLFDHIMWKKKVIILKYSKLF